MKKVLIISGSPRKNGNSDILCNQFAQGAKSGGHQVEKVFLGEGRKGTFDNPVLIKIGEKYGKTPAQVMLRWNIQRGVIVIPKSTHKERMEENFAVFDFALSDEDMTVIAELDKKESSFFSHQDPDTVEWFAKLVAERKNDLSES